MANALIVVVLVDISINILKFNQMKKVTVLNTSILTVYGKVDYKQISLQEAKELVKNGFQSAVGHQSTCDVLTNLLEVQVQMNRIQFKQSARKLSKMHSKGAKKAK